MNELPMVTRSLPIIKEGKCGMKQIKIKEGQTSLQS